MELRDWLRTLRIMRETAWGAHVQNNPPDPIADFNKETVAEAYTFCDGGAHQSMKTLITRLSANSKC